MWLRVLYRNTAQYYIYIDRYRSDDSSEYLLPLVVSVYRREMSTHLV